MPQLTIDLPDSVTPDEARLLLAIQLFQEQRVSCGRAAEVAGVRKPEFMRELGRRRIPVVNYSPAEVASDLQSA
jgi:predicted HTH domain antitoxin